MDKIQQHHLLSWIHRQVPWIKLAITFHECGLMYGDASCPYVKAIQEAVGHVPGGDMYPHLVSVCRSDTWVPVAITTNFLPYVHAETNVLLSGYRTRATDRKEPKSKTRDVMLLTTAFILMLGFFRFITRMLLWELHVLTLLLFFQTGIAICTFRKQKWPLNIFCA